MRGNGEICAKAGLVSLLCKHPLHPPSSPASPQAVWSVERAATPGGTLKLTCAARYVLPDLPSPARFVGLSALPPSSAARTLRMLACTDSGRLLRLRLAGNPVERAVDVGVRQCLACVLGMEMHAAQMR